MEACDAGTSGRVLRTMANRKRDSKAPGGRGGVPDFDLWVRLTETVTPLRRKAKAKAMSAPAALDSAAGKASEPSPPDPRRRPAAAPPKSPPRAAPPKAPSPPPPPKLPPLTGLDRRTSQRLMRGQLPIEARLDLHGETAETARVRLYGFLANARASGRRFALVITGKGQTQYARHTLHGFEGFDTPERQGRLRRLVPQWLQEPEFRALISGFQPAHPKHGGGGALYVRLRRAQPGRDRA
mgnify:CR=1 FL=1